MRRRTALWSGLAATSVLIAGLVLWLSTRPARFINDASLEQIKPGLARQEVEHILGGPPRNDSHFDDATYAGMDKIFRFTTGHHVGRIDVWAGRRMFIAVGYDENERVALTSCSYHSGPTLWERLARIFGL